MLKTLSKFGLGELESHDQLIQLAANNGYDAVEIDPFQLIQEYGIDQAKKMLADHHLKIAAFSLSVDWMSDEATFQRQLLTLPERAYAASMLGSTVCCTYILPSTEHEPIAFAFDAVRRLRLCAQLLQPYGIGLALEFIGVHHLRTLYPNPFIHTIEDTISLINAIALPNVGLLLDSYHWFCNFGTLETLKLLNPAQILYVHINDAKPLPIEELQDFDRLYPGEGVIDLKSFLSTLYDLGYEGMVTQEILAPSYPLSTSDALELITNAFHQIWPIPISN